MVKANTRVLNNKHDFFLFILLASLCSGGIGGALTLTRAIAIVLVPALLSVINKPYNKYAKPVITFFGFWLFYNTASLIWTPDIEEGSKQYVHYIVHFLLFLEIICFSRRSSNPYKVIILGWITAVLISGSIGLWELLTDQHLAISSMGSDEVKTSGGEVFQFLFASSTFGNYNTFVTFLSFSLPFIFFCILHSLKFSGLVRIASLFALLMAIVVLFYNASRGGLFSLAIISFFFIIHLIKDRKYNEVSKKTLVLIVVVGTLMVVYMGSKLIASIAFRAAHENIVEDEGRVDVIFAAINVLLGTGGFGTGIGGLDAAMRAVRTSGDTMATHNMFLELLVQYGIIIFGVFVSFLYRLLKKALGSKDCNTRAFFQMLLFAMPLTMVINSYYLIHASFWAYMASIFVFAFFEKRLVINYTLNTKQ